MKRGNLKKKTRVIDPYECSEAIPKHCAIFFSVHSEIFLPRILCLILNSLDISQQPSIQAANFYRLSLHKKNLFVFLSSKYRHSNTTDWESKWKRRLFLNMNFYRYIYINDLLRVMSLITSVQRSPRTWNVLSAQLSNYLIFLQQKCICLTKILSSSRIYLSIVVSLLFLGKTLSFRQFAIWFYGFLVGMGNIITNNNRNGSTNSTVMFFLWLLHLAEMSEEERERVRTRERVFVNLKRHNSM